MFCVSRDKYLDYISNYKNDKTTNELKHEMVGMSAPKIHCWYDGDVMIAMSKDNRYYIKE